MHQTLPHLTGVSFPALSRAAVRTLQVNLGYRCNQSCTHCHVAAGPLRTEEMDVETSADVIAALRRGRIDTLDLTGGAPELNRYFRELVSAARRLGVHVIDRCNLTVLLEPDQTDLATFLAAHQVEVIASLPCYLEENVDAQRGKGVFAASIAGLQQLNAVGYGQNGSDLILTLIYNPQGPVLPPEQNALEQDYRRRLADEHGVAFNRLYTLANMPIQRFGSQLISKGQMADYLALLQGAHRDENLDAVMCRDLISVDWRGFVYDCDFNQMLGLPLGAGGGTPVRLRDLDLSGLDDQPIKVAGHCYGCTAGQGSSCTGALTG